ncbi:hypothetical protein RHGRI_002398 [Rhododendron griersonianum]|uniref:Uncharacterized protein n=1 Tax=Rhododendron griersonianum TaxID=479676 RepID=A0AAV6LRG0_9ERIC|nr:hypothetical protein RHGRI_002398 [Rhododendron griersonianum]
MRFLQNLAKASSSTKIRSQSTTLFSAIISRSFSRSRSSSERYVPRSESISILFVLTSTQFLYPFVSLFRLYAIAVVRFFRPSFGVAFDIDGVILRGNAPIGGSPRALGRLYDDSIGMFWEKKLLRYLRILALTCIVFVGIKGELTLLLFCGNPAGKMLTCKKKKQTDCYLLGTLKVPYVFLTNGGGVPESKRALELEKQLGVNILSSQVIQGHTPFKQLVKRFEKELVIAVGKGEPAVVMSEYGFKNVLSIDDYASCFDNIDPLGHFKKWTTGNVSDQINTIRSSVCSQRVQAAFVVSDSIDWSRDIQVLCDILRTGGLPGSKIAHQPPLYFASDDLEYQAVFPSERLGMGAFRIALESIFNRIHPNALEYTSFGKPNTCVFRNAETVLRELVHSSSNTIQSANDQIGGNHVFRTLYMVGDNPSVDIKGARQAGHPWFSILTRTGVFKGKENHDEYPADLVVDTVEEAVDYILRKEGI